MKSSWTAQEASRTVLPALQYLSIDHLISITRSISHGEQMDLPRQLGQASSAVLPALQYLSIYQLISITRSISHGEQLDLPRQLRKLAVRFCLLSSNYPSTNLYP